MVIKDNLHKGEKIKKEISPHPLVNTIHYIIGGILILSIAGAIIGIPWIILAELIRRGNKYYITNKRVIHEYTFLSRKISSTNFNKIQDIHFTQGILQRLFKLGTIHINTAGTNLIEIKFKGVKYPWKIKKLIEEQI